MTTETMENTIVTLNGVTMILNENHLQKLMGIYFERLEMLEKRVNALTVMNNESGEVIIGLNTAIEALEAHASVLNTKVEVLSMKLTANETMTDNTAKAIEMLDTVIATVDDMRLNIAENLVKIETKVGTLESSTNSNEVRLEDIATKMDKIDERVEDSETNANDLESRIDEVESSVEDFDAEAFTSLVEWKNRMVRACS